MLLEKVANEDSKAKRESDPVETHTETSWSRWDQDRVKVHVEEQLVPVVKHNRNQALEKLKVGPHQLLLAPVEPQTQDQQHKKEFTNHP